MIKLLRTTLFLLFLFSLETQAQIKFTPYLTIENKFGIDKLMSVDVNNDGLTDIIITSLNVDSTDHQNKLCIYFQETGGKLGSPVFYSFPAYSKGISDLVVEDFNADGKTDIAVSFNDSILIFSQSSNSNFLPGKAFAAGEVSGIIAGDIDHDGRPEILTFNASKKCIRIFQPELNFQFTQINIPDSICGFAMGDLNSDGLNDLAVIETALKDHRRIDRKIILYKQNDSSDLIASDTLKGNGSRKLFIQDLNNDGKNDLLAFDPEAGGCDPAFYDLFFQNNNHSFSAQNIVLYNGSMQMQILDVNCDNKSEIINVGSRGRWIPNSNEMQTDVYCLNSSQYTVKYMPFLSGRGLSGKGDFNNDNRMDLVISKPDYNSSKKIVIYVNQSAPAFFDSVKLKNLKTDSETYETKPVFMLTYKQNKNDTMEWDSTVERYCDFILKKYTIDSTLYRSGKTCGINYADTVVIRGYKYDTLYVKSDTIVYSNYWIHRIRRICRGGSIIINGKPVSSGGDYIEILKTAQNSNSTIYTHLEVSGGIAYFNKKMCANDSLVFRDKTYKTFGNFLVKISFENGCDSILNLTISRLGSGKPTISRYTDILICDSSATSYQWYYNHEIIHGETNKTCQIIQSGIYNVMTTYEGSCELMSDDYEAAISNVAALSAKEFSISPNPFRKTLELYYEGMKPEILSVLLLDLNGRMVRNLLSEKNAPTGKHTFHFDFSENELEQGIYFLQVISEKIVKNIKLIHIY